MAASDTTAQHEAIDDDRWISMANWKILTQTGSVLGGQVTLSYSFQGEDGTTITPHIALKGIWDFERAEIVDLDTGLPAGSSSDLRGRIEGGITAQLSNGWSVSGEGFYDGIGARDFDAYGGSARIKVPLN
jgi:hypothetical protein